MHSGTNSARTRRLLIWNLILLLAGGIIGWAPALFHTSDSELRSPLFRASDRMGDLLHYEGRIRHMSGPSLGTTERNPPFNYPAPGAWVLAFFLHNSHPRVFYRSLFVAASAVSFLIAGMALLQTRRFSGLTVTTLIVAVVAGSPFVFLQDRGNIEWVNCFFVVLGLTCYTYRRYLPASLLFGVATAIKPFPIFFFVLLIFRRRYKDVAAGLGLTATLVLAALAALGPSVVGAYRGLQRGLQDYMREYVLSLRPLAEARFDHSLMGVVHRLLYIRYWPDGQPNLAFVSLVSPSLPVYARLNLFYYLSVALGIATLLGIVVFYRHKPTLNTIIALSTAVLVLPFQSAEYTLLLLFLPLVFFLLYLGEAHHIIDWRDASILVLLSVILLPLGTEFGGSSGPVKGVLLLALLVLTSVKPLPMLLFSETHGVP